jgi:phenylpropionate dioxygenase-like ring-hydroxylating dioxygenase large terminal subunit
MTDMAQPASPGEPARSALGRYLRNCWYVAGFSDEFGRDMVARTYLEQAVVIYRTVDGAPVALEDRCAHRRLPLSLGRLVGDELECGYHGLVYNQAGRCVRIPGQPAAPQGAQIHTYPVFDRHNYLWIWLGDAECADPALIPHYHAIDAANGRTSRIKLHLDCNYLLTVDNLLDLSHLAYVHNTTTGSPAIAEDAVLRTERDGDRVLIKRWVRNVPPPKTFAEFGGYTERVNLWQVSEFQPPSYIRVSYGSRLASEPMLDTDDVWSHGSWGFSVLHGIVPETARSTHQFRYVTLPEGLADPVAISEFIRQCDQIINEDRVIFAIQQSALDADPRGLTAQDMQSTARIRADQGLTFARAVLQQRLAAEATVAAAMERA